MLEGFCPEALPACQCGWLSKVAAPLCGVRALRVLMFDCS